MAIIIHSSIHDSYDNKRHSADNNRTYVCSSATSTHKSWGDQRQDPSATRFFSQELPVSRPVMVCRVVPGPEYRASYSLFPTPGPERRGVRAGQGSTA